MIFILCFPPKCIQIYKNRAANYLPLPISLYIKKSSLSSSNLQGTGVFYSPAAGYLEAVATSDDTA